MSQTTATPETPPKITSHALKVADAVWIATALLHRRNPEHDRFSTEMIVGDVIALHLTEATERTVWQHVNQHCVANREPNPNRSRILRARGKGDRSLFRDGDPYMTAREGSPTHPDWEVLPLEYKDLKDWYEQVWNRKTVDLLAEDPILALSGSGKHLWKDESGDEFLKSLRSNWGGVK
jgi:hypothetical protein